MHDPWLFNKDPRPLAMERIRRTMPNCISVEIYSNLRELCAAFEVGKKGFFVSRTTDPYGWISVKALNEDQFYELCDEIADAAMEREFG